MYKRDGADYTALGLVVAAADFPVSSGAAFFTSNVLIGLAIVFTLLALSDVWLFYSSPPHCKPG